MKLSEILNESVYNRPLVVVDVQPAYANAFNFEEELAQFINKRTGKTIMYINADETGTTEDSVSDVQEWWYEAGMAEDKINSLKWIDKGYGYIRAPMDSGEVQDSEIIKVIREMYNQKVTDSRELFGSDEEQIAAAFGEENLWWLTSDAISVGWLALDKLKEMSPFYICGGGREECLKEILLMCSALNIKYKIIDGFIY